MAAWLFRGNGCLVCAGIEDSTVTTNPQRHIQLNIIQSLVQTINMEVVKKWFTAYEDGSSMAPLNTPISCWWVGEAARVVYTLAVDAVKVPGPVQRCRQYQKLQLKALQVAQSGTSNDDATRFVHLWLTSNNPKLGLP